MPTIAQEIIDMEAVGNLPPSDNYHALKSYLIAVSALKGANLNGAAPVERFNFDAAVVESAVSIVRDRASVEVCLRLAKLPYSPVWFEWTMPETGEQFALLLEEKEEDQKIHFQFYIRCELGAFPVAEGKTAFRTDDTMSYTWIDCGIMHEPRDSFFMTHIFTAICLCAFLAIPKTVEVSDVEASPKLQKARSRRGKTPLLSYRKVTLRLPKTGTAGGPVGGDGTFAGKRRHQVIGHLRINTRGEAEPTYVWVTPHWRGDAALGVVLKDRKVIMS
jgi:hypothetical protein